MSLVSLFRFLVPALLIGSMSAAVVEHVPLGATGRGVKVDLNGILAPETSPTGDEEIDQRPSEAYVDMYTLSPTYSVDDVSVPMDGGELSMVVRRRGTITTRFSPASGAGPIRYVTDSILGQGWMSSLGARCTTSYEVDEQNFLVFRARVRDEDGVEYTFQASGVAINNNSILQSTTAVVFKPNVYTSLSNDALRATLVRDAGQSDVLVLRKPHGLEMRFRFVRNFVQPITGGNLMVNENYYRLESMRDRNGNQINYLYDLPNTIVVTPTTYGDHGDLLPTRIVDAVEPKRLIRLTYESKPEYDEYGVCPGGLSANGELFPTTSILYRNMWRLKTVTDPLDRVTTYTYAGTGDYAKGLLQSVAKPAFTPDGETVAHIPTVTYEYVIAPNVSNTTTALATGSLDENATYLFQLPLQGVNVFVAPRLVTDPRGTQTEFTYAATWQPVSVKNLAATIGAGNYEVQRRLRVATVQRKNGASVSQPVSFQVVSRSMTGLSTRVTDVRGKRMRIDFQYQWVVNPLANFAGGFFAATKQTRVHEDLPGSVEFLFSGDVNNNLTQVTDMSGTVIRYEYNSGVAGDPFNAPVAGAAWDAFGNPRLYQLHGKPARRIYDPTGLNLVTEYRYEPTYTMLMSVTDAELRTTTYGFNGKGNRTSVTDARNVVATTSYDGRGNALETKDQDNRIQRTTRTYSQTDAVNFQTVTTTVIGYDPGQPLGITSVQVLDVLGNVRQQKSPRDFITTMTYDAHNRLSTATKPAVATIAQTSVTSTSSRFYDRGGNLVREVDDEGNCSLSTYDWRGFLTGSRRRMNTPTANDGTDITTSRTYDDAGLVLTETDPLLRTTTMSYDAIGRLVRKDLPPVVLVPGDAATACFEQMFYDGGKAGSGAWTVQGGWQPTRVVNTRGYFTDATYDRAYRLIRTVRRADTALASTAASSAPPASIEPVSETTYNKVHKPTSSTVWSEGWDGTTKSARNRTSYTYYDRLHRPTLTIVDLDGSGLPRDGANAAIALGTAIDDGMGQVINDGNDIISRMQYDNAGNVIAVKDAEQAVTATTYDGAGRPERITYAQVAVYDPSATPAISTRAPITVNGYLKNVLETVTDANGTVTKSFFDARDRVTTTITDLDRDGTFEDVFNGDDRVQKTIYNLVDKPARTTDSRGNQTTIGYDRAYRQTTVTQPAVADAENNGVMVNPVTATAYDRAGNVVQTTDARAVKTQLDYDAWNRVVKSTQALATVVEVVSETRYDKRGNVLGLILKNEAASGGDQLTSYTYDVFDRKEQEILPSPDAVVRKTMWFYLRSGESCQQTDAKGQQIHTDLDRAGRPKTVWFKNSAGTTTETRSFIYNRLGKPVTVTDASGESRYEYDALQRVTKERRQNPTVGDAAWTEVLNDYDLLGNRTRVQYPSAPIPTTMVTTYDRASRAKSIVEAGRETRFTYDANGNRQTQSNANNTVVTFTYDALNRNLSAITTESGTVITSSVFTFDRVGNRKTMTEFLPNIGSRTVTYTYDAQYRLAGESWQ